MTSSTINELKWCFFISLEKEALLSDFAGLVRASANTSTKYYFHVQSPPNVCLRLP